MSTIDTISPVLGLLLMGDGLHNDDWGDQTNTNLETIEQAIGGAAAISGLTGGTQMLTSAQANAAFLVFTGALTSNQTIIVPAGTKSWTAINQTTGAFLLSVQTANGSGVAIQQGQSAAIYGDGTNVDALTVPGEPVGTVSEYAGLNIPDSRYAWANGQAVSRTTYPKLFAALVGSATGSWTAGTQTLTVETDFTAVNIIGGIVEAAGVPAGAKVTGVTSTTITISTPTTGGTASGAVLIYPYGNGDGSTTFNVPDRRERVGVGAGNMGGAGSPGRITSKTLANGAELGASGGEEAHVLAVAELATHGHGVTDPGHAHNVTDPGHAHPYTSTAIQPVISGNSVNAQALAQQSASTSNATTGISINGAATGISVNSAGNSSAHNNMQPFLVCNYLIRVM